MRKTNSVLVIGAGGLGCAALRHLAASGVDRIGIADCDRVEISNLPRQLLYSHADLGKQKTSAAAEALRRMPGSPSWTIATYDQIVRGDENFLAEYDVVIDCIDQADAKLALHDAVVARGIRFVHAGASGWEGQCLSVEGPGCLRCLFGSAGEIELDCRRQGVIGPVVGLLGLIAAEEALNPRLVRRLFSLDALAGRSRHIAFDPEESCSICR